MNHDAGHLWYTLFGLRGDPHTSGLHILGNLLIGSGFWLIASAWRMLYAAQHSNTLTVSGPYSRVRHPQYIGFVVIMFGFLLQWPTLLTIIMFPVLVAMYARLAREEENWAKATYGSAWDTYAMRVPAYIPRIKH